MAREWKVNPIAGAVASIAFLGFAAAPALGQTAGTQGAAANAQSTASRTDPGMQPSRSSASARPQATMADMRASRLMGRDVRNASGKEVGELTDMVVDLQANRIHYAILQRGGVLGIGDKSVPVPVSRFQRGAGDGELVLNIPEEQLEKAPGVERNVDWNDPRSWSNVGQYYHKTVGMPADATAGVKRFHQASDLIGMDVLDKSGDEVGEIEDIVINLSNGQIHYAVLEFDRAWNPVNKLVALPLSSLQARPDGNDLTINMSREQLANAPSFEPHQWPDLADSRFRDSVAGFGHPGTTGRERGATAAPTVIVIIDDPQFTRLDTDRDGRLSRQEVRTFNQLTDNWESVDRSRDGYLTREELNAGMSRAETSSSASMGSSQSTTPGTSQSPSR